MSASTEVQINLDEIMKDIQSMTPEQMAAEVLKYKTAQKVATAKYSNPEAGKKYRQTRAAKLKAMQDKLKELGLLDNINKQAKAAADAKLAADAATELENEPEEETEAA